MSAGNFIDASYAADNGLIFPVRIQPETAQLTLDTATNTEPTADIDDGLPTLVISKSRRGFGVHPRSVTIVLTADGTGKTEEYKEGRTYRIPILQKAMYDSLVKGDVGTYLGIACKLVSKTPELVR